MFVIVDNGDPYSVSSLCHVLGLRQLPHQVLPRQAPFAMMPGDLRGVFLSGGADDLDIRDPLLFRQVSLDLSCLTNCLVPILGICFGFELIIEACGGEIVSIGPPPPSCVSIDVLDHRGILVGVPPTLCMHEYNSLGALTSPPSLYVTACSGRSPVEAIQHRMRPIFATQFHPEARDTAGHYRPGGLKIVNNFIDICLGPVGV